MSRRIALLTLGDPFRLSGGYLYHLRMAAMAPRHGYQVCFFTLPDRRFPAPALSADWALKRMRSWHADAMVLDSIVAAYLAFAPTGSRATPIIGSLHQPPGGIGHKRLRSVVQARMDLQAYGRCHLLIAASELLAGQLEAFGISRAKIRVVPPGKVTAPAVGPPQDLRLGRKTAALCVANWLPAKGILDLINALQDLPSDYTTLHLVGDPSVDADYARLVWERLEHPSVGDRVVVHGAVSPANVASFYCDADFFVLPSYNEAFGTAFGEAMAAGLPVIGWRTGNLPHLATSKEAFLLEPGSVEELSAALERVSLDQNLRHRMGRAALARSAAMPTWEESGSRFFEAVRDAIS
jgi:glycosyltransferase involved in cell wall biosynthesis